VSLAVHPVEVVRVNVTSWETGKDVAATEEPLEIRLDNVPFVVTMRTPGADRELAAGFLLAERLIDGPEDIGTIQHCTDPAAAAGNVVNVTLAGDAVTRVRDALAHRRAVTTTSACGVCGRQSIDDLLVGITPVAVTSSVSKDVITPLPERLRASQPAFDATGGLHAAGLFDRTGRLIAVAEDVGRHNAVDKVIGTQLLNERFPLGDSILFVSGRTSFEIVQKALAARIPIVAAVSAPTSLAVDLARRACVTLIGFVRGGSFNIYATPGRIEL